MTENATEVPSIGRPSEHDHDRVIEAGKRLEEAGRRVTGYALRKVLGGVVTPPLATSASGKTTSGSRRR